MVKLQPLLNSQPFFGYTSLVLTYTQVVIVTPGTLYFKSKLVKLFNFLNYHMKLDEGVIDDTYK